MERGEDIFIMGIGVCNYETKKSHRMPSRSWRTKEAGDAMNSV
jgi:hypothetical protein